MSTTLVKVQHKGAVTIPTHLRNQAGIAQGDMMEVSFHRGKIILVPKVAVDRSNFPNANDEYTPAQRRVIDARLAKAEKSGRSLGPFNSADEAIKSIKRELKKRATVKSTKRSR